MGLITRYHFVLYVILSFAASIVFIWAVSYYCSDSPVNYQYDALLRKYVQQSNSLVKYRSEGRGSTFIGKYGVNHFSDISKYPQQKICIWGNSYIEAFQVNDEEKIPQVLTTIFSEHNYSNLIAFSAGIAGQSVANQYFDIPQYEQAIPSIIAHVIIIASFDDILPKTRIVGDPRAAMFLAQPYRLEPTHWQPTNQNIKYFYNRYGIYFLQKPLRDINHIKISFSPHIKEKPPQQHLPVIAAETYREAWTYLLTKLRAQTSVPVVLVYCPQVPFIKDGKVNLKDPNGNFIKDFAGIAKLHNIQFIDVSDSFAESYLKNNSFPRGFSNSRPGSGHFNAMGHNIVAHTIFDFIKKNPDVIHAN